MLAQVEARIYLSAMRAAYEATGYRSRRVFYDNAGLEAHVLPPGRLASVDQDQLEANASIATAERQGITSVVVPLDGGIRCSYGWEDPGIVVADEILVARHGPRYPLTIDNPGNSNAEYLHITLDTPTGSVTTASPIFTRVSLPSATGKLHPLGAGTGLHFGRFEGRQDTTHELPMSCSDAFVFVVSGVVEVQDRLLEGGDGLILRNIEAVNLEALSVEAMILVVDAPYDCHCPPI